MKSAFNRPDYQKFVMCPLIEKARPSICFSKCGRALETLNRAFETLGRAFQGLREN